MKKAAQDILNEIEALKGIIEACISKDQVSPADYDMITDKLRSAISMAGTLHTTEPPANEADIEERIIEKLSVVIDSIIDRRMNEYVALARSSAAGAVIQKEEPVVNKVREKEIKEEKPVIAYKKTEPSDKKGSESKILYETIAEKNKPGKSVYDMLSKDTASPDYSSKIAGQKIPDLEKAISLNEKFVFIKELFGGNARQYSLMVSKLNSMSVIDEARNFIQSDYSWWDAKDVTVKSFLELVRRRFL